MAATLRSDHVNYLIWRYLQEYGYGRTAVQLMRDWGHSDPQDLPFAPAVGPHALLSVLQDGLMYDELLSGVEDSDRRYAFINETKQKASAAPDTDSRSPPNDTDPFRKRARLDSSTQPSRSTGDDLMDVDRNEEQGFVSNAKSPPRIESTLVVGQSVGVQSERPSELMRAKTLYDIPVPSSSAVHISWDPADRSRFVVAGDSICRLWAIPSGHSTGEPMEEPVSEDLMPIPSHAPYFITAFARSSTSNALALAFEEGEYFNFETSQLLLTRPGDEKALICKVLEPVLVLRWHPYANLLLGISTTQNGGLIAIWNTDDGSLLQTRTTSTVMLDATWCRGMTFLVGGKNVLEVYQVGDDITHLKTVLSESTWEKLKFDAEFNIAACSTSSDGQLGILALNSLELKTHVAHDDQITSLEWQPLPPGLHDAPPVIRLLATASIDGSIKIWDANNLCTAMHSLSIGSGIPAMVVTFSPKGDLVAAAGDRKVVVWKSDRGGRPVASWTSHDRLVNGHAVNGEVDESPSQEAAHNSLAWNCDGSSLAYAIEDKISVISIASVAG